MVREHPGSCDSWRTHNRLDQTHGRGPCVRCGIKGNNQVEAGATHDVCPDHHEVVAPGTEEI
jgi:hypothetical protein